MSFIYRNDKNQEYYLHKSLTKKGKFKYYFSTKKEGDLVDNIPSGYEIYENPNGQVFLRKIQPILITDIEKKIVSNGMQQYSDIKYFKIDIKKDIISIYTPDEDIEGLSKILETSPYLFGNNRKNNLLEQIIHYSPVLQFKLIDQSTRHFIARRYCYLGSIDDWIEIGNIDYLSDLVEKYIKHIGKNSYFDLI